jgi:hypothetical protein
MSFPHPTVAERGAGIHPCSGLTRGHAHAAKVRQVEDGELLRVDGQIRQGFVVVPIVHCRLDVADGGGGDDAERQTMVVDTNLGFWMEDCSTHMKPLLSS